MQVLAAVYREPDKELAKQISELELTERLSAARLTRCDANLPGPDARRAVALGDHKSLDHKSPFTEDKGTVPSMLPPFNASKRY